MTLDFWLGVGVGFVILPISLTIFMLAAHAWTYWWDVKKGHLGE